MRKLRSQILLGVKWKNRDFNPDFLTRLVLPQCMTIRQQRQCLDGTWGWDISLSVAMVFMDPKEQLRLLRTGALHTDKGNGTRLFFSKPSFFRNFKGIVFISWHVWNFSKGSVYVKTKWGCDTWQANIFKLTDIRLLDLCSEGERKIFNTDINLVPGLSEMI